MSRHYNKPYPKRPATTRTDRASSTRNNAGKREATPPATQIKPDKPRFSFRWVWRNIVLGAVGLALFTITVNFNRNYHWLWYTFTASNIRDMGTDIEENPDTRLIHRLGPDYAYVLTIKGMTPENAVVFYPSRADYLASPPHGPKIAFRGTMADKLSAIRVLYPRKVVVREEMGKTPWAKRLTHIAVINGLHRDMVSYPTDTFSPIDILPVRAVDYVPN